AERAMTGAWLGATTITAGIGFIHSPLVAAGMGAAGIALFAGTSTVLSLKPRRQLRLARPLGRLADVPDGTLVRVVRLIPPQPTARTLLRGPPAVRFRNRIGEAEETRGLDFLLDLDGGEQARVDVRRAFLLEQPTRTREPPACGPVSAHLVDRRYVLQS